MIFLDDRFPRHRKVQLAGVDAGWLFVCGLSWLKEEHSKDGRILKTSLGMLSVLDDRKAKKAAARLCEVGLWHDDGDAWVVHDYVEHNRKSIERSEAARAKANKRWGNAAGSNAPASASAMPSDDCTGNALSPSSLLPSSVEPPSSSTATSGAPPDDDRPAAPSDPNTSDPVADAIELLSRDALRDRKAKKELPKVRSDEAWLRKDRIGQYAEHGEQLLRLRQANPAADGPRLVSLLLGPAVTEPCTTCRQGWLLDPETGDPVLEDGVPVRCPDCGGSGRAKEAS